MTGTQDSKRILHQRALALARPAEAVASLQASTEMLEFSLGKERYAIEIASVQEVSPLKDLTPLPCTPDFVVGVVNIRGRIIAVYDLKKFFGLADRGLTDLHRIILLRGADLQFGLLADSVIGVKPVRTEDLQAASPALNGTQYLKGISADGLLVLDAARILADPKMIVNEEVRS